LKYIGAKGARDGTSRFLRCSVCRQPNLDNAQFHQLETMILAMGISCGGIAEIFTGCRLGKSEFSRTLREAKTPDCSLMPWGLSEGSPATKKPRAEASGAMSQ